MSKTEKKKSSSKSDKKAKSSSKSSKPSKSKEEKLPAEASADFEAGLIFNKSVSDQRLPLTFRRYDPMHTGSITAAAFRDMWKEKLGQLKGPNATSNPNLHALSAFDAGAIFAKYDADQDGKLNKKDFEELILAHPELATNQGQSRENANYNLPHEVITGRLLTHYDETAGVALPRSAVSSHEQMGNTVRPLVQAYTERSLPLLLPPLLTR
jgi:hypothetical protein